MKGNQGGMYYVLKAARAWNMDVWEEGQRFIQLIYNFWNENSLDTAEESYTDGFIKLSKCVILIISKGVEDERFKNTIASGICSGYRSGTEGKLWWSLVRKRV